ncbi:DMT family transporter [Paracoccus hibiscisoli]|uniref:DMT family transporter n=1 Tax=Paracoccus hibiscisoli TaxID=2023261 RepID=A0A4U0QKC7_9RHOB|nr:DMT family transporter [Paracoccus hibiscisoli]TJZ81810.1 DMT family transporter [Paracoccus hibiscisoli]
MPQSDSPLRGIALKCASVTVFTLMAALIKATAENAAIPPGQQVFFRSFFALPVILVWLLWRSELRVGLGTANPMGHVYRGLVGTTAMALNFWALSLLPLPEVTAIGFAAPLLVVILAGMFLGENVRAFRLSMVGLGLAGVLIVLSPQIGAGPGADPLRMLGAVVALGGAAAAALAQIFVRQLVQVERTSAIVFWFSVTSTLLSLLTLPFGWVMPGGGVLAQLVLTGLLGGLGQILLTSAYRHADASVVAPFDYVAMIWAVALGWYVFAEVPTPAVIGGSALVILAGILIIWREHALGLERRRQRKATPPA